MEEVKSLDRWRFEIRSYGKPLWLRFYAELLGTRVSNYPRFYKALGQYGDWPMFEAIVASSDKNITGDPLNYVLKVAHEKWKEQQKERDADSDYLDAVTLAKDITEKQNSELSRKLKKAQTIAKKRR